MNLKHIYRSLAIGTVAFFALLLSPSFISPGAVQATGPSATPCVPPTFQPPSKLSPSASAAELQAPNPCLPVQPLQGGGFTVTLISPSGIIATNPALFKWNANNIATGYYIYVATPIGSITQFVQAASACSGGICSWLSSTLPKLGGYVWYVVPYQAIGYGSYSAGMSFTLNPGQPTLVSPSGSITTNTPTFTWNIIPGADGYWIYVGGAVDSPIAQWVPSSGNCSGTTCSLNSPAALGGGNYTWYVETWGNGVWGAWSNPMNFTVQPHAPSTFAMSNPAISGQPPFGWLPVGGATSYYLWVGNAAGTVTSYARTLPASSYYCPVFCFFTPQTTDPNLGIGNYSFAVAAYQNGLWSTYSPREPFNVTAASLVQTGNSGLTDLEESYYSTSTSAISTAGDRIPDGWKIHGHAGVNLGALGANPHHKDLFVWMDWMDNGSGNLKPSTAAYNRIVTEFNNAPVSNPDNITGINIHLIWGHQVTYVANLDLTANWDAFHALKNPSMPTAWLPIAHYMIWGNTYNGGCSSGISNGIDGSEFLVSLGCAPGHDDYEVGTFIHELGHNLGLLHGGNFTDDSINYKPNYISIMNYQWQFGGVYHDGGYDWTYSFFGLPTLDEANLNEPAGFGIALGSTYASWKTSWSCPDASTKTDVIYGGMDWNCNGFYTNPVAANIDQAAASSLITLNGASAGTGAAGSNWSNLRFDGGGVIGSGAGAALPGKIAANSVAVPEKEPEAVPPGAKRPY